MTPLILAIAAGVVLVIGATIMIAVRSRGEDEGARFRHVADITSTWSRQSGGSETRSRQSGGSETRSRQSGGQPLPYPDTNAVHTRPEPQSDETTALQPRPGRPRTKGR